MIVSPRLRNRDNEEEAWVVHADLKSVLESEANNLDEYLNDVPTAAFEAKLEVTLRPLLLENPEAVLAYVAKSAGDDISNVVRSARLAGMLLHDSTVRLDFFAAADHLEDLVRRNLWGHALPQLSREALASIAERLDPRRDGKDGRPPTYKHRTDDDRRGAFEWVAQELSAWVGKGLLTSHLTTDRQLYQAFSQQVNRKGLPQGFDVPPSDVAVLRAAPAPELLAILMARAATARSSQSYRQRKSERPNSL